MTPRNPAPETSVIDVLDRFAEAGWTGNHVARPEARMKCGNCAQHTPTSRLDVDAMHRIEGASDPDDMQMVLGIACPECATLGAVVVSYGPNASEADAEFIVGLDLDGRDDPVADDPEPDNTGDPGRE